MDKMRLPTLEAPIPRLEERRGDCYQWALRIMIRSPATQPDRIVLDAVVERCGYDRPVLVHGFPKITNDPDFRRMGHAWVELTGSADFDDAVWDPIGGVIIDRGTYYAAGSIEEEHTERYTLHTTLRNMDRHQTYGPWASYRGEDEVMWA